MSRRSRHRRQRPERLYTAHHRGGWYTPPDPPAQRLVMRQIGPTLYLRTRARALDHPVFAPRTVRPPLMRTVLRDTTSRKFNNRRQADLPARALARMKSWPTFETPPLPRALTCARRQIRREVLFAMRAGNGAGSRGVPKSKERCT